MPCWTSRPLQDQDQVGVLGGGQPVGDGERGPALGESLDGVAQRHLGGRVDRRGGLVQDQAAGSAR